MNMPPISFDHLAKVIEAAIGANDPPASAVQIAAHLAKQSLKDKHFNTYETKDEEQ